MTRAYVPICPSTERTRWLEARRKGIGGSESKILLLGNYYGNTPYTLWASKVHGVDEMVTSEAADLGLKLEKWCFAQFSEEANLTTYGWGELCQSIEWPWLLATPDAVVLVPNVGECLLQVKTAGDASAWEDGVPEHVYIQIQHELAVTGLAHGYAAVLGGGKGGLRFRWAKVDRDPAMIADIVERTRQFWGLVESKTPPAMDGQETTTSVIGRIFPKQEPGKSVALEGSFIDKDERLKEIDGLMRQLAYEETEIKNAIRSTIGDAEIGVLPNGVTWTYKTQERKEFTVKASTSRVLRRHERKT